MAGWEDFLTERDKQHLAVWGKKGKDDLGERPAVLVVDAYYNSVGHERKPLMESIKDWPMSCGLDGWQAIDCMVELLASARSSKIPIVYVRGLSGFPSDGSRVKERGKAGNRVSRLPPKILALGNEIVAEVAPHPEDLVIGKTSPSAFAGTPLLHYLRMINADTLIVCGETTSGCVRAAVVDGAANRYKIGVVQECCYDRTQASHWINLFDMHQKYGEVMNLREASAYLDSVREWRDG